MRDLVLVKIGGSLITDKRRPGSLRRETLRRVAREVAAAARAGRASMLLGHGSGSFGHAEAARHGLRGGPCGPEHRAGIAATQDRAARLHRHVVAALESAGATPFSAAPSSFLVAREGRPVSVRIEPIERALELGLLPVTFGDVVIDRRWGACICATEAVLLAVARALRRRGWRVRRAVWLGATDGVYDGAGQPVRRVAARGIAGLLSGIREVEAIDVTGGMALRLRTAARLARSGVPSWIVDGRAPGALAAALASRAVGTRVVP